MAKYGKEHPMWKGGRKRHSEGYWLISNPKHHRANNNGYVLEHILVAEKFLGRDIKSNEIIHHINYDVSDNSPYNLYLCQNPSEHKKIHRDTDECNGETIWSNIL